MSPSVRRRTPVLAALLVVGAALPSLARAAPGDGERRYRRGLELSGQARCEEALVELRAAEAIDHAPRNLREEAKCEEALGQRDEALAHYRDYLRLAEQPPEELRRHVEQLEATVREAEARAAQEERRFDDAMKAWEAAQSASPDPRRWFEMAVCAEALGDPARAVALYQRYLAEVPWSGDVAEVRARILLLGGGRVPEPPPPPRPPAPPLRRPWFRSRAGWALATGALALGVAGGALLGSSSQARGAAESSRFESDYYDLSDRARLEGRLGIGLLVVGGATLLAAAVLFLAHTRPIPSEAPR